MATILIILIDQSHSTTASLFEYVYRT